MSKETAKAKLEKELDSFERDDQDANQQTGYGNEEYGEWQQLMVSLCQLRNDSLLKKKKTAEGAAKAAR